MRKILLLLVCIWILLGNSIATSAHPGKTDSNGGHTNRTTEEYHYHHGYSAHSHYDMNGDGTLDCPYDFKDHTRENIKSTNAHNNDIQNQYSKLPETSEIEQPPYLRIITNLPFLLAAPAVLIMSFSWVVMIFSQDLAEKLLILSFRLIGVFLFLLPIWGVCYLIKMIFNI